jgi:septal ring factor EnvC (AmiA/AmiB activator)
MQTDSSFLVFLFAGLWLLGMIVAAALLIRANAQISRHRDSPTPRKAYQQLADDHEAQDVVIGKLKRDVASLEVSVEKLHSDHRSLQNQMAAAKRRTNEIDATTLADYLQAVQASESEETGPEPRPAGPGPVPTLDGHEIDFR